MILNVDIDYKDREACVEYISSYFVSRFDCDSVYIKKERIEFDCYWFDIEFADGHYRFEFSEGIVCIAER